MAQHQSLSVKHLARLPNVAREMQTVEGNAARDLKWWADDHFQFVYQAGGMTLVPATQVGLITDLDDATLRALLAALGVAPQQRLTMWWMSGGDVVTLPTELIAAHLLHIWLPSDDVLICAPPSEWGLFLYHEGQFSVGRVDPTYAAHTSVEDCRRPEHWLPPNDMPPDADRQRALLATLIANREAGHPPCSDLVIQTRGDLHWLMAQEVSLRPHDHHHPDGSASHRPDLRQAIMREANLDGVLFRGANLAEANLRGANLTGASLQFTDLRRADLTGAILYRARFLGANLAHATLRSACLNRACLRRADLADADFTGAQLAATQISARTVSQVALTAADTTQLWVWSEEEDSERTT